MKRNIILTGLLCLIRGPAVPQASESLTLEQKVAAILQLTCNDGCGPVAPRLLKAGPADAVSAAVLHLAEQYKKARGGDHSVEYLLLTRSVFALGKLHESAAIPLLTGLATQPEVPTEILVYSLQSKSNDPSLLTELEVAAAHENDLRQTKAIQALADAMRARMNALVRSKIG